MFHQHRDRVKPKSCSTQVPNRRAKPVDNKSSTPYTEIFIINNLIGRCHPAKHKKLIPEHGYPFAGNQRW